MVWYQEHIDPRRLKVQDSDRLGNGSASIKDRYNAWIARQDSALAVMVAIGGGKFFLIQGGTDADRK